MHHVQKHPLTSRAVWVKRGVCSADSLINIALCCLGFLPGLIHAWYIILQYPDQYEGYEAARDREHGHDGTTHYYVSRGGPPPHGQPSYGTVGSNPSGGQFPGQQSGVVNSFSQPQQPKPNAQPHNGVAGHEIGGEGSSQQPAGPPPTYADVIKGDNEIQHP